MWKQWRRERVFGELHIWRKKEGDKETKNEKEKKKDRVVKEILKREKTRIEVIRNKQWEWDGDGELYSSRFKVNEVKNEMKKVI